MPVEYLHLPVGAEMPTSPGQLYKAVVVLECDIDAEWRNVLSDWLVKSGCRYLMAWGAACGDFHDSVDWAELAAFNFGEVPDENLVMTTWHEGEPLTEVFGFSAFAALHPTVELNHTLIIDISPEPRRELILTQFTDALNS